MAVEAVLALRQARGATWEDLKAIEQADRKGRFQLERTRIRAVQGHTMPISDRWYEVVRSCEQALIHGTYDNAWVSICNTGIQCMERQHVHLSQGTAHLRADATIHIYINSTKWFADGKTFLKAPNGVILSRETISPEYFHVAWHLVDKVELRHAGEVKKESVEKHTRAHQVKIGKKTLEWNVWAYSTPEQQAMMDVPDPPDPYDKDIPKRQFNRLLSQWRVKLHRFADMMEELDQEGKNAMEFLDQEAKKAKLSEEGTGAAASSS